MTRQNAPQFKGPRLLDRHIVCRAQQGITGLWLGLMCSRKDSSTATAYRHGQNRRRSPSRAMISFNQRAMPTVEPTPKDGPSRQSLLSRAFNWFSNVSFAFSVLSTVAALKTWNDTLKWVADLSAELGAIIGLVARTIHWVLIPWHYCTAIVFWLLPIQIPASWRSPIILAILVVVWPLFAADFLTVPWPKP